jgi:MFS transporter, DHA2 family, methylenomycin A resistance protein
MGLAQFMIQLDTTIVNVALPSIQRELDVSPGNLLWTVNAYILVLASLILIGGTLGDRLGRRRVFLAGLAVFTAMSAACALAPDDPELIVFRAAQGAGAALMSGLTLSILVAAYPGPRAAGAIGIWATVGGLGFGLGPIVGGLLLEQFAWSSVFWINVPIGGVVALLTLARVAESRDPHARGLDPLGAVLIALALGTLSFALIETDAHGWLSAFTLGLIGAGIVLGACFVLWERVATAPLIPLGLFRRRSFAVANGLLAVEYGITAGVLFFLTLFFQNVKGWSALETGIALIALNFPFLATALLAARLVRTVGARAVIAAGIVLGGVGTLALALVDAGSTIAALWPLPFIGLGFGLALPALSTRAMAAVEASRSGLASGVTNTSRQIGGTVGLSVLGAVGFHVASRSWATEVESLPASAQARAADATQLVAGGQADAVGSVVGADAVEPALSSFVSGFQAAMWIATGVLAVSALGAVLGLGRAKMEDHG